MTRDNDQLIVAAAGKTKEKEFWTAQFAGQWERTGFPYDFNPADTEEIATGMEFVPISFDGELCQRLLKLSKGNDHTLNIILAAGLALLLSRYTGNNDILFAGPIYKQDTQVRIANTILPLRNKLEPGMTFKALLMKMKQNLIQAINHYSYPMEVLLKDLGIQWKPDEDKLFPLFDVALLLENIHDPAYLAHIPLSICFRFKRTDDTVQGKLQYNGQFYEETTVRRIASHYINILSQALASPVEPISHINMLSGEEKDRLLTELNQTAVSYPRDKSISSLFEQQVEKTPDHLALSGPDLNGEQATLTYSQLNDKANRLARVLQSRGIGEGDIVALMLNRSIHMTVAMMAVLKVGAIYFFIDPETPSNRVRFMMDDCRASLLLTQRACFNWHSFSKLQNFQWQSITPHKTPVRPQIKDLDSLPLPDRSMVDYHKYDPYIGDPMVKNTYITMQATRGCPFSCAYCHKIWPKSHMFRSAAHIFEEIKLYYDLGVRRFSFVDDVFNLNIKNSKQLYQMLTDHKMDVQLFFPSGFRGDILTPDYIDLMVEAGTVLFGLALESASPRIQKLMGKNLNIEKFRKNAEYIVETYPNVILEFQTMLGFPTETEEEALLTLDFIKSLKWLHFPYVNILRIYSNTDMERLALQHGISKEQILASEGLAYHELPETLPFNKKFTATYQNDFLNNYFLSKERLMALLPHQARIMTKDEMVQKYNSYLPMEINRFQDLLDLVNIDGSDLDIPQFLDEEHTLVPDLNIHLKSHFESPSPEKESLRILLLDLSQIFADAGNILYDLAEPPLGLMALLTYLKRELGNRVDGKIAKSRFDFQNFQQLHRIILDFDPHLIGIRTLTYYKDFFHQTIAMIRQWGIETPIISGGPYASSNYGEVLQNHHIDLIVLGEGEVTFTELVEKMLENQNRLPDDETLKTIKGLTFVPGQRQVRKKLCREVLVYDFLDTVMAELSGDNLPRAVHGSAPAVTVFTSGSTGKPKGTLLTHAGIVNHALTKIRELDIQPSDVLCHNLNIGFVASIWLFLAPLFKGAKLFIFADEDIIDPYSFFNRVARDKITVAEVVPSLMKAYMELLEAGKTRVPLDRVKVIALTGEKVTPSLVNRIYKYYSVKLVNAYGQSECSDDTLHYAIPYNPQTRNVPIGRPSNNTRVYVLDSVFRLLPTGVAGELCISGDGLAIGYLDNPRLTSEKFIPNPFENSNRMFRTGDLVKWLPDGNIEYIGRVDHQVKVRGFRIELEEIERFLLNHPRVQSAVVASVKDENQNDTGDENTFLCAYIIRKQWDQSGQDDFQPVDLREFLARDLPDYMVPTHYREIQSIPLTPSGKVDRKQLPAPTVQVSEGGQPQINDEVQRQLAQVWADILKIQPEMLGEDANFFKLGGNSLRAVTLVSRIHQRMDVNLTLVDIFDTPTIGELAKSIKKAGGDKFHTIKPSEKREYYPLSSAQKRLFILQQMDPGGAGYNTPQSVVLEGDIDTAKIESIFHRLTQRHESLRTSFHLLDEEPVQRIHGAVPFSLGNIGPNGSKGPVHPEILPFDLSRPPLFRSATCQLPSGQTLLFIDMHHIITDGTSMMILLDEFNALYQDREIGEPPAIQYKDYALWSLGTSKQDEIRNQEGFWLDQFNGEIQALNLPYDFPRPAQQSFEGGTYGFILDKELTGKLKEIALQRNATLYMVLLSAFSLLLSKLSGQEEIVVGTPTAGRRHQDLHRVIGMFVNTLALRTFPQQDKSFDSYLDEIRQTTLAAFENQEYQFEDLVEKLDLRRDAGRNPLFDVMFILQNVESQSQASEPAAGLKMKPYREEQTIARFDLSLVARETGEALGFALEYCVKLFEESTIKRFAGYYKAILHAISQNTGQLIGDIDIIPEQEKKLLLETFNDTIMDYPGDKTIHRLIHDRAQQIPDAPAVLFEEQVLTYGQLMASAGCLASQLRGKGAKQGDVIGLMVNRSSGILIGLLGILLTGAAYLPIDPEHPAERIQYTLEHSGAVFTVDDDMCSACWKPSTQPIPMSSSAADLAYVIYTSGSTGKPKGVAVEHRSVVNFIEAIHRLIPFTSDDAVLSLTTVSFDIFGLETLLPLSKGSRVAIGTRHEQLEPQAIARALLEKDITIFQVTPSRLQLLVAMDDAVHGLHYLKYLLVGGEAFPEPLLEAVKPLTEARIFNMYGPTETTIWSTVREVTDESRIDIGKPIGNTSIYILDKKSRPRPLGVAGELYIGGEGVARGYYKNPGLTRERFLPDPFTRSPKPNAFYRTGDLARWLPSGNIEFLGRVDHQIKLRGFRIEPQEIQDRIKEHQFIKDALVILKEDAASDKFLCAYYVPQEGKEIVARSLSEHLGSYLPEYMIPSHFVSLDAIPLNPSGKVDRKALPEPAVASGQAVTGVPADLTELKLIKAWSEVLHIHRDIIGTGDNFFQLGGHSLKAVILANKLHQLFNVDITLTQVFRYPTVSSLARYIRDASPSPFIAISPAPEKDYYPLSSAQKRLYILQQMEENSTAYNLPHIIPMNDETGVQKLENVFKSLIQRHESLRTSFHMIDGQPVQRIHDTVQFTLGSMDPVHPAPQPFDLSRPPLIRAALFQKSSGQIALFLDMHHIISDATSIHILSQEAAILYDGGVLGETPVRYRDYCEWQGSEPIQSAINAQRQFWLDQFKGELPVLNLPLDYDRPQVQRFDGDNVVFILDKDRTQGVKRLAGDLGATLFMTLLSVYNIILARLSGQQDIVVGTPVAGRRHEEIQNVIGVFINTLALRQYPDSGKSFKKFLAESATGTLEAFENQDYPFEDLVEQLSVNRDTGRNPLFDVMFILHNEAPRSYGNFILDTQLEYEQVTVSKFDMTLAAREVGDCIAFSWEYCTRLFKKETIQRFCGYFQAAIDAVIRMPEIQIADIDLISVEEKHLLLETFNNTAMDYPREKTLHQLVREQALRTPEAQAVIHENRAMTYKELMDRSAQLANLLKERGVKSGDIAGLMVNRSENLLVGLLGILSSGAAYLPIDPDHPRERIRYMLEHSGTSLTIDDAMCGGLSSYSPNTGSAESSATDLAYVIYTSGSTGNPKGVAVEHRSVVNFIEAIHRLIPFTPQDTILSLTTVSFDIFGLETLLPLSKGSRVAIGTKEEQLNPEATALALNRNNVTIFQVTPSRLRLLVSHEDASSALTIPRYLLVGGEAFPPQLLEKVKTLTPARIFNMYGPTETTIWSTVQELTARVRIDIGKPIGNTTIYILDKSLRPQPLGVPGELFIGGDGVARGYFKNPELTAQRFIQFSPDNSPHSPSIETVYCTGDLARWLPSGDLEFLGRVDHQIKLRGFRIEPAEIQRRLTQYQESQAIKEALVVLGDDGSGDKFLCAYYVAAEGVKIPAASLRDHLARTLPDYMVPAYFINLDVIPLNPSGKVDRKALPAPEFQSGASAVYLPPEGEIEEILVRMWAEILKVPAEQTGRDADFFRLGGHSLKAVALSVEIHRVLQVKVPLTAIFNHSTIAALAAYLAVAQSRQFTAIQPAEKRDYYPQTSGQKRLFLLQQVNPSATLFNMPIIKQLQGELEARKLENAFRLLIERHQGLRSSFELAGDTPVQRVHESVPFELEQATSQPSDFIRHFVRPFDLSKPPLMRAGLVKKDNRYILMVDLHHIITDGLSQGILMNEFMQLYQWGEDRLPSLKLHYKDYAQWRHQMDRHRRFKEQEEFWSSQLAGELPLLQLPLDFQRPGIQSMEGDIIQFAIEESMGRRLLQLAEETGATPFMMLLAIYNVFLSKLTGQQDLIVGTAVAGRNHAELQHIVGIFVNLLALRNFPRQDHTFMSFLREIKDRTLAAFDNQDYPYEELLEHIAVERHPGRGLVFDTVLSLDGISQHELDESQRANVPFLDKSEQSYKSNMAKYDLVLHCYIARHTFLFTFVYCTRLFQPETVQRFSDYFINVVSSVLDDPNKTIGDIQLLDSMNTPDLVQAKPSNAEDEAEFDFM